MISAGTQDVLAFPADLPALPRPSQPVLLADMDALSHGLAEGSATNRATDTHVSASWSGCCSPCRSLVLAGALAGGQRRPRRPGITWT